MTKTRWLLLFQLLLLGSCRNQASEEPLRINKIQVIGSHNSYKEAIEPALLEVVRGYEAQVVMGLEYTHISISDQLDLGLRNLEIDVYADSLGGKYARPKGLQWVEPMAAYDPDGVMVKPGFKVFHVPDIDFRSSCPTLEICLHQLKLWSDTHPDHTPVFITLEAKGGGKPADNKFGLTAPENFTRQLFDQLDSVIRAGLGEDKLIVPDKVRSNYKTLEEAILKGNWPMLDESRGKFLFILDDSGEKRDLYIQDHPSLIGRAMFVNADPGTPEAATLIRNNPLDAEIKSLVKRGYIVRTRADADTKEARLNDYSTFNVARESGAQIITTDYYQESAFFDSPYHISFEDSSFFRTNPLFINDHANQ